MKVGLRVLVVLVCAFTASFAADENPFVGTWKLNPSRSGPPGDIAKFEKTASGAIRWSGAGLSYTFKMDGKDYLAPYGALVVWKQIDDRTWECNYRIGDQKETRTVRLSPDGQTLTTVTAGTQSNGESFRNTVIRKRISGDKGLLGEWKDVRSESSNPITLEVKPSEQDGLVLTYVGRSSCDAKFDGKDYPVKGPTGMTIALKRSGPRSFVMLTKQNGKPLARDTITVSQDGRTLTIVGKAPARNQSYTEVFDRQ